MKTLLQLNVVVEPDRQRLARFVCHAVADLGGSVFEATQSLATELEAHRQAGAGPVPTELVLDGRRLYLCWGEYRRALLLLPGDPPVAALEALTSRLKSESEATDPELLRQINEEIQRSMDSAVKKAADELGRLERDLSHKKAELRESLRVAETDPLTGLLNRGAYDLRLNAAVRRCLRQGEPLTLLLLDLDEFKQVNDTHGHQYGDRYLQRMADGLRSAVREDVDFVCRIGGDEFVAIVFADSGIGRRIAGKLLDHMQQRVSIGIAALGPEDTAETLVARADAALYAAKENGRGQYRLAPEAAGVTAAAPGGATP